MQRRSEEAEAISFLRSIETHSKVGLASAVDPEQTAPTP